MSGGFSSLMDLPFLNNSYATVTTCSEGDHYLVQVVCVALLGVCNQSMALVVDGHHGLVCVIECEKTSSFSPTAAEDSKAGVWK